MVSHSGLITVMQRAVRKAAPRLRRDFGEVEQLQVSRKGPGDFVSMADKRAEQTIVDELRNARPDWGMLLEEGGEIAGNPDKPRWIVDPLDGTTNFLHGIPHFSISIAVEEKKPGGGTEITHGMVYQPVTDEEYWAEKGRGAWLQDRRLRVSARRDLAETVIGTGIPHCGRGNPESWAKIYGEVAPHVSGIRRFGSAALDLAWVAAGRYEGFWELGLNRWDIAAGIVMVREAGGMVTDPQGGDGFYESGAIVCGNPTLQPKLREVVAEGIAAAEAARASHRE
jgi:myo-inositol-1(or 4)-monophosphatase